MLVDVLVGGYSQLWGSRGERGVCRGTCTHMHRLPSTPRCNSSKLCQTLGWQGTYLGLQLLTALRRAVPRGDEGV